MISIDGIDTDEIWQRVSDQSRVKLDSLRLNFAFIVIEGLQAFCRIIEQVPNVKWLYLDF